MTAFRHAHKKIERANKHIAELEAALLALQNAYSSTVDENNKIVAHDIPEIEDALLDLALIIGDVLHNLHTALDFAWGGVIAKHLPASKTHRTKFPVYPTEQELKAALHGIKVDTTCPPLFNFIMSEAQPYNGGKNRAIFVLHNLDISDKHLLLLDLVPSRTIKDLAFRDENGKLYEGIRIPLSGSGKHFIEAAGGIQIHDQGRLSITVTLKEAGPFKSLPALGLLRDFSQFVTRIVKRLEFL